MAIIGGGGGGGGATTLDALTDVTITTATNGDLLQYNGAQWVNVTTNNLLSLNDLSDVIITGPPAAFDILMFAAGIWQNFNALTTDWLSQYLHLPGRSNGQVLGAGLHSGVNYDFAIEGKFLLGDITGVNYTNNRGFEYRKNCINNVSQMAVIYTATTFTGVASGTWRGLLFQLSGTAAYTSGSFTAQGMFFTATMALPAGVTGAEIIGALFQATPGETNSGTQGWTTITGGKFSALGPSAPNLGHVATLIRGVNADISNRAKACDLLLGVDVTLNTTGSGVATIISLLGSSTLVWNANATAFYYSRFNPTSITGPTKKYGIWLNDKMVDGSVLGHKVTVGALTDAIHGLDSQSSFGVKITANKVAVYNAANETVIPCDATAAAFVVNLPTAVGIAGRVYIIKKVDATANAVTVTPNGAETIDGAATVVLAAQWAVTRVISDNANWLVI